MEQLLPNASKIPDQFVSETISTLYMVFWTALIAGIIGLILGVILILTDRGGLKENRAIYSVLDKIVNICRSIPFIIMLAIVAPLTRFIIGTTIGDNAAIVPLVIGTFPFYARQIQNALTEVDAGVIEAARSIGDSPFEIVTQVYLKEGLPAIIRVSSLTLISLVGLTAMAGAVGAGGLGKLAITQGYNRFMHDITLVCTILILIIVFIFQAIGDFIVSRIEH